MWFSVKIAKYLHFAYEMEMTTTSSTFFISGSSDGTNSSRCYSLENYSISDYLHMEEVLSQMLAPFLLHWTQNWFKSVSEKLLSMDREKYQFITGHLSASTPANLFFCRARNAWTTTFCTWSQILEDHTTLEVLFCPIKKLFEVFSAFRSIREQVHENEEVEPVEDIK